MSRNPTDDLNDPNLFLQNKSGCYTYSQNNLGKSAFGQLTLVSAPDRHRDNAAQSRAGGEMRRGKDSAYGIDDGGHLIGTLFGGSSGDENLTAQDRNLNRSAYRAAEAQWQQHLKANDKVFVSIDAYDPDNSGRPSYYGAYAIIEHPDGSRELKYYTFNNESKQVQQDWEKQLDDFYQKDSLAQEEAAENTAMPYIWDEDRQEQIDNPYYQESTAHVPQQETSDLSDRIRSNVQKSHDASAASRYQETGLSSEKTKLSSKNFDRVMESRGLSKEDSAALKASFTPGTTMEVKHAQAGEEYVVTHGTENASGVFVTSASVGSTPQERIDRAALPPSNTAEYETSVALGRDQDLISGRIAPQEAFTQQDPQHLPRSGGAEQIITDGGYKTGAIINHDTKYPIPTDTQQVSHPQTVTSAESAEQNHAPSHEDAEQLPPDMSQTIAQDNTDEPAPSRVEKSQESIGEDQSHIDLVSSAHCEPQALPPEEQSCEEPEEVQDYVAYASPEEQPYEVLSESQENILEDSLDQPRSEYHGAEDNAMTSSLEHQYEEDTAEAPNHPMEDSLEESIPEANAESNLMDASLDQPRSEYHGAEDNAMTSSLEHQYEEDTAEAPNHPMEDSLEESIPEANAGINLMEASLDEQPEHFQPQTMDASVEEQHSEGENLSEYTDKDLTMDDTPENTATESYSESTGRNSENEEDQDYSISM